MKKYFNFFIIAYLTGAGALSACSFFKPETITEIQKGVDAPSVSSQKVAAVSTKDPVAEEWARHLAQADAIYREAWRLSASQELPLGKSPFGRAYRPVVRELGVKMSTAQGISCDRYAIKKTGEKTSKAAWEIRNDCGSSEQDWLATIQQTTSGFELNFSPEEMQDVVGVQSSILFRSMSCRFNVTEHVLVKMECDRLAKDKSATEVLRFDVFRYQQKAEPLLLLQGKVLVNLSDQRKFEFRLPQQGKGLIVETELFPPEAEVVEAPTPPPALPAKLAAPQPPAAASGVGPAQQADQLRRRLPPGAQSIPEGAMGGRRPDPTVVNDEQQTEGISENEENNEESSNEESSNEESGEENSNEGSSQAEEVESAPVLDPRNSR